MGVAIELDGSRIASSRGVLQRQLETDDGAKMRYLKVEPG
jgi:hypothetical protein